jgi:cell wall-associated NlpC family hydrolase
MSVERRWTRRLRIRKNLLARAERALEQASAANQDAARALVRKRRDQVAYAERVLARQERPKTTARERAVRAAMLGVKHRDQIRYTQDAAPRWEGITRRCRAFRNQFPTSADCSSFVTWCIWDALGGPNAGPDRVNGASWCAGYTGTQTSHGKRVSMQDARPGDLVFYGSGGTIGHVAMLVDDNKVVSHGSNPGPMVLAANYRPIAQIRSYLP